MLRYVRIILLLIGGILLLPVQAGAQTPSIPGVLPRSVNGGTIFRCLFDAASDAKDLDKWPDDWQRRDGKDEATGIIFPPYTKIVIVENRNEFSNFALQVNLRGGAAGVLTPKIPIRQGLSYTASVYLAAENLKHNQVYVQLNFYSKDKVGPVKTVWSEKIQNTRGWRQLTIGPMTADMPAADSVSIGIYVVPVADRQDFDATVDITNVELRESPTVQLSTRQQFHLFTDPRGIDVECRMNGIDPRQQRVQFSLEDAYGRVITQRPVEMQIGNTAASLFVVPEKGIEDLNLQNVTATWRQLPISSPGFYRVRVATPEPFVKQIRDGLPAGQFFRDPLLDSEPLTLAVVGPLSFVPHGDYGWNLDGQSVTEINAMLRLLAGVGVSRIKLSAWLPEEATKARRQELIDLCNIFAQNNVGMVGLLTPVPVAVEKNTRGLAVNAASIFSLNPETWASSVAPTVQDLSRIVRDWQLTHDDDLSLTDIPAFRQRIAPIRKAMDPNAFRLGIGFPWDWADELPQSFLPPQTVSASTIPENEFVSLTSPIPMTVPALADLLDATATSHVRRWVSFKALPKSEFSLDERITNLVLQLATAKIHGAEMLFASKPFDDSVGLMRKDKTPNELFVPWQTTVRFLSGKPYLGEVTLPNRSRNLHFDQGGGECVMVVWNPEATPDKPVRESLYLGDAPEIVDVWGRTIVPEINEKEQVIPVGPVPVFVTGVDTNVLKMRQSFSFEPKIVSSRVEPQTITMSFKNIYDTPVGVLMSFRPFYNDHWRMEPVNTRQTIDPDQTETTRIQWTKHELDATGNRPVRIPMIVTGVEKREFAIYDEIFLGDPDVSLEFSSRLNQNNEIEVTQALINNGDRPRGYFCSLHVQDRPTIQQTISPKGYGRYESTYTIPRGSALLQSGVTHLRVTARGTGDTQPMVYTFPIQTD